MVSVTCTAEQSQKEVAFFGFAEQFTHCMTGRHTLATQNDTLNTTLCQRYVSIGTHPAPSGIAPSGISSASDTWIIRVGVVCTRT